MPADKRLLLAKAKALADAPFAGLWRARFHGSGLQFSDIRGYVPGDDVRRIDWRATARRGRAHVKLYEEERQATVWFALCHSGTWGFGTRGKTKGDTMLEALALLAASAAASGDRMGFVCGNSALPARRGEPWAARILEAAETCAPAEADVAAKTLLSLRARNGLCVFVSDGLDLPEDTSALAAVRARNAVLFLRVADPFEESPDLPGAFRLPDGTLVDGSDAKFAARWREKRAQAVAAWDEKLSALRIRHAALDGTEPAYSALTRTFSHGWTTSSR